MLPKRPTLCRHFYPDGSPRFPGCPKGSACQFVHPGDSEWDSLVNATRGRGRRRSISPRRSPPRRHRSPLAPRRLPSPRRRSPPRRSTSPRRYPPIPRRTLADRSASPPRREPSHRERSPVSHHRTPPPPIRNRPNPILERSQGNNPSSTTDGSRKGTETPSISSKAGIPPTKLAPAEPKDSAATAQHQPRPSPQLAEAVSQDSKMKPTFMPISRVMEPKVAPPPLPPPSRVPFPNPPSFVKSAPAKPIPPQPSTEEKLALWTERVKAISEATFAAKQKRELEADAQSQRALVNSYGFQVLSPEDQKRLRSDLAKLGVQRDAKTKQIEGIVTRLAESDSWPVIPGSTQAESEQASSQKDLLKYVKELMEVANSVKDMLAEAETNRMVKEAEKESKKQEKEKTPVDEAVSMDMDTDEASSSPAKEKQPPEGDSPGERVSEEEIKEVREKLVAVADVLQIFQGDLVAHEADVMERVDARIEAKVEEWYAAHAAKLRADATRQEELAAAAEQTTSTINGQINELAQDTADMIQRFSVLETELVATKNRNMHIADTFASWQAALQAHQEQREKNTKAIEALQNALAAQSARPPSPPTQLVSPAYMLSLVEEPLLDMVHSTVQEMLEEARTGLETLVREQNAELYTTIWDKLSLTFQMVSSLAPHVAKGNRTEQ